MEETAAVPQSVANAKTLVPHLRKCGYGDARLAIPFRFDTTDIDVVAFAGKPWDNWSACLAAVNLNGDSKASAAKVASLGVTSVFVCGSHGIDWWGLGAKGPTSSKPIKWEQLEGYFREHKAELAPRAIYDAKLRRPSAKATQLTFFDVGLMPAVEKERGETLLRVVRSEIDHFHDDLGDRIKSEQDWEHVYRAVFWLLTAKVLNDKGVPNFQKIKFSDVEDVFARIGRHHGVTDSLPPFGARGLAAMEMIAGRLGPMGSLADVSSESIAYLYEHALIDKAAHEVKTDPNARPLSVRKRRGIHGTPSVLRDHMLAQLWPLIEDIKPGDRTVLEPACGHAPFLTGMLRWLREWDAEGEPVRAHAFLRDRMVGLDDYAFARELAKLNLTIADAEHKNSWTIKDGDMFAPGVLRRAATNAHILLSNPPYESFVKVGAKRYLNTDEPVTAETQGVEMLKRTLPNLPTGGVFGVVMPVGVLHDRESKPVREELLRDFDLSEISVFADNLFEHGDHEVAVLMGRKKKPRSKPPALRYRRVREAGMAAFKERLAFSHEDIVDPRGFARDSQTTFRLPDLREVWAYCDRFPKLGESFSVTKGHEFYPLEDLIELGAFSTTPRHGWLPLVLNPSTPYSVLQLPVEGYLDYSTQTYRPRGGGAKPGVPQVVINESGPRSSWRFRAVEDPVGLAIQSRFLVARPKANAKHSLTSLWAVLNSPVANGFAYCWSEKRHTTPREWLSLPLPDPSTEQRMAIEEAANTYRALAARIYESQPTEADARRSPAGRKRRRVRRVDTGSPLFSDQAHSVTHGPDPQEIRAALLRLDSTVLSLYDLPPRLERQLLDLFTGVERKGVGLDGHDGKSTFRGYYPPGFTSALPLHMVISEQFERARADKTAERFKPGASPYMQEVLSAASAGTGEA